MHPTLLARELATLAISSQAKAQEIASRLGIDPLPETASRDKAYQSLLEARAMDDFLGKILETLPQPAASPKGKARGEDAQPQGDTIPMGEDAQPQPAASPKGKRE